MSESLHSHPNNVKSSEKDFMDYRDITIERCPHDDENPYTQIKNDLIRDISISPECRWLIIYLLSNKQGWQISMNQMVRHLSPHMGRKKVEKIFEEAINSGYIKKESILRESGRGGKLKSGVKYIVSESPKFKKCLRNSQLPENRSTDLSDDRFIGETPLKKNITNQEEHLSKKQQFSPTPHSPAARSEPPPDNPAPPDGGKPPVEPGGSPEKRVAKVPEISPEGKDLGDSLLDVLLEERPSYAVPKSKHNLYVSATKLITIDKREPDKVRAVLRWALQDDFWRDKMFCANIAKYLSGNRFDQLEEKMRMIPKSKIDRRGTNRDGTKIECAMKDNLF